MSIVNVEHLTFSYPNGFENVFEDVSFHFDTSWKLGLVGRNGRGKTTLLELLMGKHEYRGSIQHTVEFEYFPFDPGDRSRITEDVLFEACPAAEEWEFMRELSYLDVDSGVLWRPFDSLSNGEQTKVLLAALFLNEGEFMLIDEPTNHLDAEARAVVSQYLSRKKGFLLVSHDRKFLDGCVDHVMSLNRTDITIRSGDFSGWLEEFERTQESELALNSRLQKDIKRLESSAAKSASWSGKTEASKFGSGPVDRGFVGHRSAKMMKRSKAVQARKERAVEEKAGLLKNRETAEELKISPLRYHSDVLVTCDSVVPVYDGAGVCEPVSFRIHQGDCIFLAGRNGSGKSSILKLITGCGGEYRGTLTVASGLKISYVPQDTSGLRGGLREFIRDSGADETLFKAILRKMDFGRDQFDRDMADYSEGQKKKVWLTKSLCEQAHLYIWDEPLNYIDIYSRMQIEDLIRSCRPTMIMVEHDAAFREAVATDILTVDKRSGRDERQ